MATGKPFTIQSSDPTLTDLQYQLTAGDAARTPYYDLVGMGDGAGQIRNDGAGNYGFSPSVPPGFQFGFLHVVSVSAGLDYYYAYALDAPVPYPATVPANTVGLLQFPSDSTGRVIIRNIFGVLTSGLLLTDGAGTVIDAGSGTPIDANSPLSPLPPPGDMDSPGQVTGFYWDGLPLGVYTATSEATGAAAVGVTISAVPAVVIAALASALIDLRRMVAATSCPTLSDGDLTAELIRHQRFGVWAPYVDYAVGDRVIATVPNGRVYRCVRAGQAGVNEPRWFYLSGWWVSDVGPIWADDGAVGTEFFDLQGAARDCWMLKASRAAGKHDISGAQQKLSRSQVYDHCIRMANRYAPVYVV